MNVTILTPMTRKSSLHVSCFSMYPIHCEPVERGTRRPKRHLDVFLRTTENTENEAIPIARDVHHRL